MLCKMNGVVKQQAFVCSAVPQTLPPFTYFFLEVKFSFLQIMFLTPRFQRNRKEQSSLPESAVILKHPTF